MKTKNELKVWEENRQMIQMEVKVERLVQLKKWGPQKHSFPVWQAILAEEVGELAQEVLRVQFGKEVDSHDSIFKEAIQVAAVAMAIAQFAKYGDPV